MMRLETAIEHWELVEPFATARDCITHVPVIVVRLTAMDGQHGRGEAAGVDYDGETPQTMTEQLQTVQSQLHAGVTGEELASLLPAGGARNALDCALWDLRARQSGVPVWRAAGLPRPRPVTTAFTIGLGDVTDVRRKAEAARGLPRLKLKVDAERHVDLVRVVREVQPHVPLLVDANQSWTRGLLERLMPPLRDLGVELIEQPLARGLDGELDGLAPVVPLAADESCTDRASLAALRGRYQFANVKLDKCGGLTEAFALCHEAERLGFGLMVGNMCGTSLAMAPAFLIAQRCRHVDLDGPLLQRRDRPHAIHYEAGRMHPPSPELWG